MTKSIVISERDNIAALIEDKKVTDFFIHKGDILLGDIYLAKVENILPSIEAAFVNVGSDKMGFLHASDVTGKGALAEKIKPKQKVMVQVVKEPTGHKGPRVTMSISLPGRFLVLMPDEKGINVSRKITSSKEKSRLKSIVSLLKPAGVGVIVRTEAEGQSEAEIQEDLEILLDKWSTIVNLTDSVEPPNLLSRDQDLLYRVIREACSEDINEIVVDTSFALHRTNQILQNWNMGRGIKTLVHKGNDSVLVAYGVDKEIKSALQTKVNLPSGGYLFIQQTEALTVVDINSGKFVSSATQAETIRRTNLESVHEIARQLRLRNIGGMIIIDFIDMENRVDKLAVLEALELALEPDKSKPNVGQLSDLGLVELTRHRQGQSLAEIFTKKCPHCNGAGAIVEPFNFATSSGESESKAKAAKLGKVSPRGQKPRFEKEERHTNKPHIKTTPSLAASASKAPKPKEEVVQLDDNLIQEFFTKSGCYIGVSKGVNIATIPSKILRYKFTRAYNRNVFEILAHIEGAFERQLAKKQFKPKPRKPRVKQEVSEPQEEVKPIEVKSEEKPSVVEVKENVIKTEEPKVEEPKLEEAPKPKRRGRPPKAAGASAAKKTTRTRKVTKKKTDEEVKE